MLCNANRIALAGLFFLCLPVYAQEARGTLLGRVTDSTDAVLVGAKVEARNVDTGIRLTSVTNSAGDYIFPLLVPGSYTVTVENSGFKTYTRSGIVVRVNDQVTINVSLEVGQASQTRSRERRDPAARYVVGVDRAGRR